MTKKKTAETPVPEAVPAETAAKKTAARRTAKKSGAMNLVIVESPAKATTIQKYLGPDYEVVASMGHVRDLPKSTLGVDTAHGFTPQYILISGKEPLVRKLKSEAAGAQHVYLATDPDREGEAISWHLATLLGLPIDAQDRVTFNEITHHGVEEGMAAPRKINLDLVNAQQGRRILDRIVGYKLSPFLWKSIRGGSNLSAGRVQSVAVRLIVDREREIEAFVVEEYWTIDARLSAEGDDTQFSARLAAVKGEKADIKSEAQAKALSDEIAGRPFTVSAVKRGVRKKQPAPPFTTSTMQQEASLRLGFQSRRTMRVAQELYEGVEVPGMGAVGLITYMRTDSLRVSDEAKRSAAAYIEKTWGPDYLPPSPRTYKTKAGAQDAHEAIRPTMPELTPQQLQGHLSADQYKLYRLVWERFIASQMATALLDTVSVDIEAGDCLFKASGYNVRFDGFTKLYESTASAAEDGKESVIPHSLAKGDALRLRGIAPNQHFTLPPPRFTEASLIKALEENGIGRPSTYAPIITTIIARNYVERDGKALKPTALGTVTTDLIREHFSDIMDVAFTARMEKELDTIGDGKADWVSVLSDFYKSFSKSLETAEQKQAGERIAVPEEETDVVCELCGRKMVIKTGRYGKFLACPGYPECKNTKRLVHETGGTCPLCGGKILTKKSKTGKTYYGCEHNPECKFMTWDEPSSEKCPVCGSSLLVKKGRNGRVYCSNADCGYEKPKDAETTAGEG